jgi:hypothetical protein
MVNDHENWIYHLMTSGTMTGWGDFAGSVLNLTHQPSNGYYGMQVGFGANNKNSSYGFSGEFYYTGSIDGAAVSGTGDFHGDLDCTQPVLVSRNYVATDCAGNSTSFSYQLSASSTTCLPTPPIAGPFEDEEDNGPSGFNTNSGGTRILSVQPNPASDHAYLNYVLSKPSMVGIQLYSASGNLLQDIFHGWVEGQDEQVVEINLSAYEAGLYQLVVLTESDRTSEMLMIIN